MPRKTNGTRSRKNKAVQSANAAPANPGRRYELLGLACVAAGLISLGGLFDLNVGFCTISSAWGRCWFVC